MHEASTRDIRAFQPSPADSAVFHVQCPICGGSALVDKYTVNKFTVTKCTSCSLLFVRERLSKEILNSYYSDDVDYVYNDPVNIAMLSYYFQKARNHIENRVRVGRILDIGCSAGTFLDVMVNWERHGSSSLPRRECMRARSMAGTSNWVRSRIIQRKAHLSIALHYSTYSIICRTQSTH
jgi:predicted Rdx family selenoprotein